MCSLEHVTVFLDQFSDLRVLEVDLPLEDTFVDFATRDEIIAILAEETVTYLVKVLAVAVVIRLAIHVGVVEQSERADLVSNRYDGLTEHFANLHDLVLWVIEPMHAPKSLIVSETRAKPLKLEVQRVCLDGSICFYLVQGDLANLVLHLHVVVVS